MLGNRTNMAACVKRFIESMKLHADMSIYRNRAQV